LKDWKTSKTYGYSKLGASTTFTLRIGRNQTSTNPKTK